MELFQDLKQKHYHLQVKNKELGISFQVCCKLSGNQIIGMKLRGKLVVDLDLNSTSK